MRAKCPYQTDPQDKVTNQTKYTELKNKPFAYLLLRKNAMYRTSRNMTTSSIGRPPKTHCPPAGGIVLQKCAFQKLRLRTITSDSMGISSI